MSMRPPQRGGGGDRSGGNRNEGIDDPLLADNDNLSDDDNAQVDVDAPDVENEDPLLLAIDDLEGRVVAAVDEMKLHPGISATGGNPYEELAILLRPVLEVAAHTGPSVARTYYRGTGPEGIEASVEDAYERTVPDLTLPVLLEMAQSVKNPIKRVASLEFFRNLYKECHKAGSWLDTTTAGMQAGPYGPGGSHHLSSTITPAMRVILKRRQQKRLVREGELLRYWLEAACACACLDGRGILAASAALRPALQHIAQRIRDADDRGAVRLFAPVMKLVEAVVRNLFVEEKKATRTEDVRAATVKFLEILLLCCSHKPQDDSSRRKGQGTPEGFSLDDLPIGHPTITREALESIADYTFTILRGFTLMGGQVKIDANMLQDMLMRVDGGAPIDHVVAILKPAALAFLEIESSVPKSDNPLDFTVNRSSMDFDFHLSQKSYALTINAMSAIATNRPSFFHDASVTLAQRAVSPPSATDGGNLTRTAVLVVSSQLRASCLTLLRNASSITTNASDILHKALVAVDMELQADKALQMASQANQLKTASRSARNQAKMFYEWDASEVDRRSTKRQKETDDALAKMRAAKRQRGLGSGIQLPTSMSDAIELVLLNLEHLPKSRPAVGSASSETPITLDYVIDAVMTNGASLLRDEGRWYDRNGGTAWLLDVSKKDHYEPGPSLLDSLETVNSNKIETERMDENSLKRNELFMEQSRAAASDAVRRILLSTENSRWKSLAALGSQLASRLAFILRRTEPSGPFKEFQAMAKESAASVSKLTSDDEAKSLDEFMDEYPLVSSTISLVASAKSDTKVESSCSYSEPILNEAMMQSCSKDNDEPNKTREYDMSLYLLVASGVRASQLSKEKPNDGDKKKAAALSAARLQKELVALPRLTPTALVLLCALCDIDDITKKATESSQKKSQDASAASTAALYDAKAAAEKRATSVLLTLRDVALQRDMPEVRNSAVECVVGLASGRLPTSASIHDKALKLTVNVLFPKNETIADMVLSAVQSDLEIAASWAIDSYDEIQKANADAQKKETSKSSNSLAPRSDVEKAYIEKLKRPSVLVMALCVRRIELVKRLFQLSCQEKAEVLAKAVRLNMSKLAAATAAKYGVSGAARQVAEMLTISETSMLLAFLDQLVQSLDKALPNAEIVEACFHIQEMKSTEDGKRDPRYLIPIVSGMKREDLVHRLPEFVSADDEIFLSALVRMGDRLGRHALHFRDEPDAENPSLLGMTLCEQLVFLHRLDFNAAGIPQKRYLAATKLCLENEMFTDQVLMSALDVMSGQFLTGEHKLPLAFMRTNIIVISNHESLHAWMCNVLLPRLVEGQIWSDPRQWEGWMRCAHMLEQSDDPAVSSASVIGKLPPEQLLQYRTKWAGN